MNQYPPNPNQPNSNNPNNTTIPSQYYPTKPYSKSILFILLGAYVAFWLFVFIAGANAQNKFAVFIGSLGTSLFWGILASVLVMDWRGATSINGWIRWQQMRRRNKILLGLLCICVSPFLLGVYLIRVLLSNRKSLLLTQGHISSRRPKVGIVVGAGVTILALIIYSVGNASGAGVGATVVPTPTNTTVVQSSAPTATPTDPPAQPTTTQPTPTQQPTQKPAPAPTQPPQAQPTPTQKPAANPCPNAINGNPWCYDFNAGNLIYNPPSDFCNYFHCIPTFYASDDPGDGYIDQCADGLYSQSGGESGACSHHGGESRPLYSH